MGDARSVVGVVVGVCSDAIESIGDVGKAIAIVPGVARGLLTRVQQSAIPTGEAERLVELIEKIVVYTFPRLSQEEIATMLGLTDLIKDSRFD